MPWKLDEQQIFLHRPHLDGLPDVPLPHGYRQLANSDALLPKWVGLLDTVFGGYSIDRVRPNIESDLWDPDRVKLVAKADQIVALCMAWHEPRLWPRSGFVFWVAVVEGHRRRGPGSFVLGQALEHIARDGLRDAVVYTDETRLPAMQMYLKFGFQPLITGTAADERDRWRRTFDQLGRRDLLTTIRDDYARVADDKLSASDILRQGK